MKCTYVFKFIYIYFLYILGHIFLKGKTAFLGSTNRETCKDYSQILPFQKANMEHKDCVVAYMCF